MANLDFPTIVPNSDIALDQAKQFDAQVAQIRAQAQPQPAPAPMPSPALAPHGSYYADPNFGQDLQRYRDRVNQLLPGLGDFAAAQARLETGNGQNFSTPYNFGNINNTDSNPKGGGGFSGPEAAADAYVNFLTNNGGQTRYQALLDAAKRGADVGTLATLAKAAGYATDPNYAAKVAAIAGQPLPANVPIPASSSAPPTPPPTNNGNGGGLGGLLGGIKNAVGGAASAVGSTVHDELAKFDQLTAFDQAVAGMRNAPSAVANGLGSAANAIGTVANTVGTAADNAANSPVGKTALNLLGANEGAAPGLAPHIDVAPDNLTGTGVVPDTQPHRLAPGSGEVTVGGTDTGVTQPQVVAATANTPAANVIQSFPQLQQAGEAVAGALPIGADIVNNTGELAKAAVASNAAADVAQALPGRLGTAASGEVLRARGVPPMEGAAAPPPPPSPDLAAFNQAPAATNPLAGLRKKLEEQVADRFAALNRLGPQSEAAMGAYAGRTDAAVQRATRDLKPAYEAVADVPNGQQELNTYVGLQRYMEVAREKGTPVGAVHGSRDVQEALQQLPAVPNGMVRLFRGEDRAYPPLAESAGPIRVPAFSLEMTPDRIGRWFTSDAQGAMNWASHSPDGVVRYVDVPEEVARAGEVKPEPGVVAQNEFLLPRTWANAAKDVRGSGAAVYRRNGPGGIRTTADAEAMLDRLASRLGPDNMARIQQADAIRQDAMNRLLQDKVDSGFLTQQAADELTAKYPHYNPTILVDYLDQQGTVAGSKLSQRNGLIKALTQEGSAADQVPPMQSAINAIVQGSTNIQRNEVIKTIANEGGFTAQKASAMLPKDAITYFDGGQRMALTNLPSDVSRAMTAMTTEQLQGWQRVAMGLNQSLRVGATTLNPAFLATNAARDWVQAYTREGISPIQDIARMLPTAKTRALKEAYIAAGGGMGSEGGYFVRGNTGKSLAKLERQITSSGGLVIHNMADLKKLLPTNLIRNAGEAVEMGPRLATFEKHLKAGEAAQQAALAGRRVTVDFSRAGTAVRSLNALVPFLNARVQGSLTMMRTLRDVPAARLRLAGLMTAAAGAYAWNRQFPEYADVPDYIKQNYLVVMLPGSQKNPTGPGYQSIHYVAVPVGDWGVFTVPLEAALRKIDGQNPGAMDTITQTLNATNPVPGESVGAGLASVLPITAPGRAGLELAVNKDFYRGTDIVPESEQRLLPEQQIGPQTSLVAQRLGQLTHTSPRKIDFAVREMTGGGGRLATEAISQAMGQASDTTPVVGGLASGVYRNYGGQTQQSAYDNRDKGLAQLQDKNHDMYVLFGASGHPLGGPDAPPPTTVSVSGLKVPLYPADQLTYAQQRDAIIAKILARPGVGDRVKAMPLAQRQAALADVLTLADETAKGMVLKSMGRDELQRRVRAAAAAPPKPTQAQDLSGLRFSAPPA